MRRRSPPEVVSKMLQAIDELNETKSMNNVTADENEPMNDAELTAELS